MQNKTSSWVDQFARQKRKLRISVTDRCNFKCSYCMPEHPQWVNKKDLLSFEELFQFCELMVEGGIENIRITGGEPLMRKGVVYFIERLQSLKSKGLRRVSMTTNGHYLQHYAQQLKDAGLDDLNVSLDSLNAEQFQAMTKSALAPVLVGIERAMEVGLTLKINAVLIKNTNENQILDLVVWAKARRIMLRFIEFMPLDGDAQWNRQAVVAEQEILQILGTQYRIQAEVQGHEPARSYVLDADYRIGIISTISHSFCGNCDRIRLTGKGELYNCLFAMKGLDLRQHIAAWHIHPSETLKQNLLHHIQRYIWHKEAGFDSIFAQKQTRKISMHMIGG
ncbi:GTP 3',8-cyclase MoaA [Acinetobacter haemolyticus]|nr:GTP 3',8-cyclase MoaA [Acinetobacter haemolyticus]NAR28612.1 GTP 3',8-cyclase MoaA [Acinetobacter haemolyticus]NAR62388.1 GTP 3',8-cyclase MoaA [Acinetobacter haemolyticus]